MLEKVRGEWVLSGPVSEITGHDLQPAGHTLVAATLAVCRAWHRVSLVAELGAVCRACHPLCRHSQSTALFVIRGVWFYLQSSALLGEAGTVPVAVCSTCHGLC